MKLGDIAIESKVTFKGDKTNVPIVGLENIEPEEIVLHSYEINAENTFSRCFHKGQILFGRRRAYLKKAAVADFDGICSGDIIVIEPIEGKVEPSLLPFIIQNDKLFNYAVSRSAGGLSPRVKWQDLANYEFDLPPLSEQKALADKLWTAYRLKESYKKLLQATDDMVKAEFINRFGLPNQTHPESSLVSLQCVLETNFVGDWGKEDKDGNGTKVLTTKNFRNDGLLDYSEVVTREITDKNIRDKKILPGDILLERSGGTTDNPVGRTTYFKKEGLYLCNNFVQVLRCSNEVNSLFVAKQLNIIYSTQKRFIRSIGNKTTGIQNVNLTKFLDIKICVPEKKFQDDYADLVEKAEQTKSSLRRSISSIDKVIKSIINN